MSAPLTADEKRLLLRLARAAVVAGAGEAPLPAPGDFGDLTPALRETRGAFVTLRAGGHLRGCIGHIEGIRPLAETVLDNALSAAFRDPRFAPVAAEEVANLQIEISALTPLRPVGSWRDIEVPRHGVLLARGARRAVFLPQVAAEQGWDRDTLLDRLARKAGLPDDGWRRGAELYTFRAVIFGDAP